MSEQNKVKSEEVVVAESTKNMVGKNKKMFLFGFLILIGVALVVIIGLSLYRVYRVTAEDRFTGTVARALRFAAGKVDGRVIAYSDYTDDLRAIRVARESAKEANKNNQNGQYNQVADFTDEQLSDQVFWRLVTNILSDKAAKTLGIKVEQKEIDDQKARVVEYYKTIQGADAGLLKDYGWNLNDFSEKVIRPYILQNKLAQAIAGDATRKTATVEKAQKVLEEVKGGLSFSDAVKKYSEDSTAAADGEWAEVTKEQMQQYSPALATAVAGLKKGEVTKDLITLPDGLHIIKLEDITNKEAKDAAGKKVNVELYKLKHVVLLFPTFSDYLDDLICKSDVKVYLHVNDPFKTVKEKCQQRAVDSK